MPKTKEQLLEERRFSEGVSELKRDLDAAVSAGKITKEESDFLIQLEYKLGHADYPLAESDELDKGEIIAAKVWPEFKEDYFETN
jgi:hypothetical protein